MDTTLSNDQAVFALKNKFRGLVSAFKSKKFVNGKSIAPSATLRHSIKLLFLEARAFQSPSEYKDFVQWVQIQSQSQLLDFHRLPIGYEELQGIHSNIPTILLSKELTLLAHRIAIEKTKINAFLDISNEIELLVFKGRYDIALELVERSEKKLGVSFWSVQLNIALIHIARGLEKQKRYTAGVRSIYAHGLLNYISYYTSVRNEDLTTPNKFNEDLQSRLANHKNFDDKVKIYIDYKLSGKLPKSEVNLQAVLEIEQSHSIVDIYDTYIKIIQNLIKYKPSEMVQKALKESLVILDNINDFRLDKLKIAISKDKTNVYGLKERNTHVSDALFQNKILDSEINFKSIRNKSSLIDPWQFIYAGFIFGNKKNNSSKTIFKPHHIHQLFGTILRNTASSINYLIQLKKLNINFNGLKSFSAFDQFTDFINRETPDQSWKLFLIGLNSPFYGIEDIPFNVQVKSQITDSVTRDIWTSSKSPQEKECHNIAAVLFHAINEVENNNHNNALVVLQKNKSLTIKQPYEVFWNSAKLHALYSLSKRPQVVELIANSVSNLNSINNLLPIKNSIEKYEFRDIVATHNPLAAPIVLFLLWQRNESGKTLSSIRSATRNSLKKIGVSKPSELTDEMQGINKLELVFFLSQICVPQVIDVIRVIKSSKEVLLERQEICRVLILLDPNNKSEYSTEALDIENELLMSEGKRVVDGTRIYVDMDSLSRWASKAIAEDFSRYRDLVKLDVGTTQRFDELYIDAVANISPITLNFTPEDEADAVLFNIVKTVGKEFLTNPTFGLDFYLSKRIRHQSFIGLIRSHYEFSNLITTRETKSKDYDYNHYWIDKFTTIDQAKKLELNRLLATFALEFDELLLDAKDSKFQIKSEEHPNGLIGLSYSHIIMGFIKQIWINQSEIGIFIDGLNTVLWAMLNVSLQDARVHISNILKIKIANSVDNLKANIKHCVGEDPAYVEFEMELSEKSALVQRSLDEVITWFTPLDLADYTKEFSLEQIVKIGINGVLSLHKAFKPKVNVEAAYDEEILLSSENLAIINDTLFILFDNVKEHSGIKTPKINISVKTSLEDKTLNIIFVSDSKPSLRKKHEEELAKITTIIDRNALDSRTRKEGRSGIIKLAATVRLSNDGNLNYGFDKNGRFKVELTYSMTTYQSN